MEFTAIKFVGFARGGPDSLFRYRAGSQLGVLAEGRGGFSGGGLAAELAVDLLPLALSSPGPTDPLERWRLASSRVHDAIRRAATVDPFYRGMEAGFAACHFDGQKIVAGNIGRNRIYRVRDSEITQITRDGDSLASTAGGANVPKLDLVQFAPMHGDLLLICTAKTYHSIHKSLLCEILQQDAREPEIAAREIANSTAGDEAVVVVGRVDSVQGRRGSSGAAVIVED